LGGVSAAATSGRSIGRPVASGLVPAVDDLRPLGPIDVVPLLPGERRLLVDLLRAIDPGDWERPTECPAWTVKGVALHVLGDDLSLLARQRDAAVPSLLYETALPAWESAPDNLLDRSNERWVHAATYLSPQLIVDLLSVTGERSHAWYSEVGAETPGEVVMLFGTGPAPYWQIAAREYLERWAHHLQVRRALGRAPGPLGSDPYCDAAIQVAARALPRMLAGLPLAVGTTLCVCVGTSAWTYVRETGDRWRALDGAAPDPVVRVSVADDIAPTLYSRGLARADVEAALELDGDPEVAAAVAAGMAAVLGR